MTRWELRLVGTRSLSIETDKVQGKQRPRMDTRNKRTFTPRETLEAEGEIMQAWIQLHGMSVSTFDGPVKVCITYSRPLAKSNPKYWAGRADLGKPDVDNAGKTILDALNGVAYKDDSQVISSIIKKGTRTPHGGKCRIDITVTYYEETRHEDNQGKGA